VRAALRPAVVLALVFALAGFAPRAAADSPQKADMLRVPAGSARLPPEFVQLLKTHPYAFFRLVNRSWASRVCDAFGRDRDAQTNVRLHGDAHIEQYAFTDTAYGLDDFDDTAEGPAVIDLVRFIGSIRVAAQDRGWADQIEPMTDAFLRGYQRGLDDPTFRPDAPRFVTRLRRQRPLKTQAEFLDWAEGLMTPVPPDVEQATRKGLRLLAARAASGDFRMPPAYFAVKRVGAVRLGIGSRRLPKLLVRVEGPSTDNRDDVILEEKEPAANLTGLTCMALPAQSPAARVVTGVQRVGRLEHDVLTLVPAPIQGPTELRHWWIHDWSPSYSEVEIALLESPAELIELARDAGVQLGSSCLPSVGASAFERRRRVSRSVVLLDARIRDVARKLTDEMYAAWKKFGN
jgi:uncharacterized protein DUF2252